MKQIINLKIFLSVFVFLFLFYPFLILAQRETGSTPPPSSSGGPTTISYKIGNPFKGGSDFISILNVFLEKIIMPLASVFIVLAIIYSGFKFVMAQGDPKQIQDARTGLMYVLIGTAVLLGATGISSAVKGTLSQLISF